MSAPLYSLRNVRQSYNGRPALDLDELDIPERSILGLAGHNGSGKSTLLRILAFLEAPAAGTVAYAGRPAGTRDAALRREVTLLTQEPYLLKRSVLGNVAYGLKVRGEAWRERAEEALGMVGLAPEAFARRSWRELSGGEAQRVALAARLALRPRVLLLDEPTNNLDRESAARIKDAALAARAAWGATLVVVSHDMPWLSAVADQMVFLADGRIQRQA
ncbi:MAG: ATP-binding cassette domain-containing protein [Thermodesulfobacteriota bacterium]